MKKSNISYSRLGSMRFCPRQHHYAYTQNLEPIAATQALDVGTLVHSGIENFYRNGSFPPVEPDLGEVGQKVTSALSTYALLAQLEDRGMEIVDIERKFELPIEEVEGAMLKGVIDLVVRIQGDLYLMEHKTCAQHWSNEQIQTAPQHQLYEMAAESIYEEPVDGTYYNFLRITKRGGDFHTDAKRTFVPKNYTARAEAYEDMLATMRNISDDYKARNSGSHCHYCRFFALCQSDLLGGDTQVLREQFYKPRREEELESEPA